MSNPMSEIKPVGHLVTEFGGDACLVTNEKKIQILAEMGWPIVTVYDESALAQARAEEREHWKIALRNLLLAHNSARSVRGEIPVEQVRILTDMEINATEASIRALSDTDERTEK